jgi:hypothetical protein
MHFGQHSPMPKHPAGAGDGNVLRAPTASSTANVLDIIM